MINLIENSFLELRKDVYEISDYRQYKKSSMNELFYTCNYLRVLRSCLSIPTVCNGLY